MNKPSGLLTQAPSGIDSLERRVKAYLARSSGEPEKAGSRYLGVPHRLDRPSSGVLLFGKHVRATRRISEQFEARSVEKIYRALLGGHLEPDSGTWVDYVRKIPGEARAETVLPIDPLAREAVLHFQVLERLSSPEGPVTLIEVRLETGRMHQVRIQAASRGFPLLGDKLYGSDRSFGLHEEDERLRPVALHAWSITLRHPMSKETLCIMAPTPATWS